MNTPAAPNSRPQAPRKTAARAPITPSGSQARRLTSLGREHMPALLERRFPGVFHKLDDLHQDLSAVHGDLGAARHEPPSLWPSLLAIPKAWRERTRGRRILADMNERELRDLGLSRSQVVLEAHKPFWRS
jgi:uncharacterized protein YjiS (DUF1127 family)